MDAQLIGGFSGGTGRITTEKDGGNNPCGIGANHECGEQIALINVYVFVCRQCPSGRGGFKHKTVDIGRTGSSGRLVHGIRKGIKRSLRATGDGKHHHRGNQKR